MLYDSNVLIDIGNICFNLMFKIKGARFSTQIDLQNQNAHVHPTFEFLIVLQGNASLDLNEENITISSDDILILLPETFHHFTNCSEDYTDIILTIDIFKNKKENVNDFYTPFSTAMKQSRGYFHIKNKSSLVEHIKKVLECYYVQRALYNEITNSRFTLFFSELVYTLCPDMLESEMILDIMYDEHTNRVQFLQFYITMHYMEDINLKKIADILNLSEVHTNRIFRQIFGKSFLTYLTDIRLKNAKRLLRRENIEISDIATLVGYNSYNGFYIAFKKEFGITPNMYRKKYRK